MKLIGIFAILFICVLASAKPVTCQPSDLSQISEHTLMAMAESGSLGRCVARNVALYPEQDLWTLYIGRIPISKASEIPMSQAAAYLREYHAAGLCN